MAIVQSSDHDTTPRGLPVGAMRGRLVQRAWLSSRQGTRSSGSWSGP